MTRSTFLSIGAVLLAAPIVSAAPWLRQRQDDGCKVMPSDGDWPSLDVWNALNASVDGRLIKTIPVAAPCHTPSFNKDECTEVQDNWGIADFHLPLAGDIMYPVWLNKSCDPFTAEGDECIIGQYVEYSVDVATPEHIASTAKFAKDNNIRLIVKNSGHDLIGRSTGAGALSIWTHNLGGIEIVDYKSDGYTGKAVKAGAGVSGIDLETAAHKEGLFAVGGQCPTVGFVGGYLQGGGHSMVSSRHGMGADQVLEWNVVTTEGDIVKASPAENQELYWALSGGGPGTYGIVYGVTVKAFADVSFASASITLHADGVDADTFFNAASKYWAALPNITAAGAYAVSVLTSDTLAVPVITVPDYTSEQLDALLSPLISFFKETGVKYDYNTAHFDNFLDMWTEYIPVYSGDVGVTQSGGRFMPSSLWEDESSFNEMVKTFRNLVESGIALNQFAITPTLEAGGNPDNAVLPAWRTSQLMVNTVINIKPTVSMEEVSANWDAITNDYDPQLKALTPGGGAYINEANPFEPDWQEVFFGENYDKLLEIKDKYDPAGLLYGRVNVGSDRWVEKDGGRLCRA